VNESAADDPGIVFLSPLEEAGRCKIVIGQSVVVLPEKKGKKCFSLNYSEIGRMAWKRTN
jgi:hypothetical protein